MRPTPEKLKAVLETATQVCSYDQIMHAFDEMAVDMTEVLESADPIMLCVMNGGLMTMSELAKRLNFPLEIDYVHATRYRGEFEGGAIHWLKEPSLKLAGRVVVVVDDILDGGITLAEILAYCKEAGALEVYSAVLVDKQVERSPAAVQQADFTGIYIEDRFVFGFGLDYHNYLRNLPHIYAVSEEHMK